MSNAKEIVDRMNDKADEMVDKVDELCRREGWGK